MKINQTKAKLVAHQPVLGVISNSTDPTIAEICGFSGLDFYMIDGEHSPVTTSQVQDIVRACEVAGITPLARIRSTDPKLILQFMDAGVMGVMMPGIKTPAEVQALVAAIKYPPHGQRGLGPVRAWDYGLSGVSQLSYVQHSNEQTLVLPQIEDLDAVANLDALIAVVGVDGFVIGPRDLAMSMGYLDGPNHDEVRAVMEQIIDKVLAAGLIIGTTAATAEQAKELIDRGVQLVLNSTAGILKSGIAEFMKGKLQTV
jgi:4-hydroxy-2-oxoheptanedioate aldolase